MARGRCDLAAIVNPMRLKPNASGRYLIAEGCFRLVARACNNWTCEGRRSGSSCSRADSRRPFQLLPGILS